MWATVIVLGLLAVLSFAYWWLGRIWPETREKEAEMREDRRRVREALSRRFGQPPEDTVDGRPDWRPR